MATKTKAQLAEQGEYLDQLREMLKDTDVIYTIVTHTSQSGMQRTIRPFIIDRDRRPFDLTWLVSQAGIGKASDKHGGIVMDGCGMDMAFELVYRIGRAMENGQPWQCRGDRCASNEHINPPRVERDGVIMHTADSGYRFRKETL